MGPPLFSLPLKFRDWRDVGKTVASAKFGPIDPAIQEVVEDMPGCNTIHQQMSDFEKGCVTLAGTHTPTTPQG